MGLFLHVTEVWNMFLQQPNKLEALKLIVAVLKDAKRIIHKGGKALHEVSDHRTFLKALSHVMWMYSTPHSNLQDSAQCLVVMGVIYELVDNLFADGSCTNPHQLEEPPNDKISVFDRMKNVVFQELQKFPIDDLLEKSEEEETRTGVRLAVALLYRDCGGSFRVRRAHLSTDDRCSHYYKHLTNKSKTTSVEMLFKNNLERLCAVCDEFKFYPRGDFAALDCCYHLYCYPCAVLLFTVSGARSCILCPQEVYPVFPPLHGLDDVSRLHRDETPLRVQCVFV